jgi:spore coat polysaccharide biosynthesis protein SpsF
MMIVAIIQARMNSGRLPGKVLLPVGKTNLLALQVKRISASVMIDKVIIATTTNREDDQVADLAEHMGVSCYRGSETDVLDRYCQAAKMVEAADYIIRLTADCPFMDPVLIDDVVREGIKHNYDYYSNTLQPSFPDGLDIEVIKYNALVTACKNAVLLSDREHVTPYVWRNSSFMNGSLFTSGCYVSGNEQYGKVRLTVDEEKDYEVIKILVAILGEDAGWKDIADHFLNNADVRLNTAYQRNEGYQKSLLKDNNYSNDQ